MSNFETAKIGFALALLGVVFTVHPIISPVLGTGIVVFGFAVALKVFYYAFVGALVLSVYLYALDLLIERPTSPLRVAGNALYAIALVLPPAVAFVFLASEIAAWITTYGSTAVSVVNAVTALGSAIVGALSGKRLQAAIGARDALAADARASVAEADHISRAKQMLTLGHFDLAALEAWSAVETALRAAFIRSAGRYIPLGASKQVDAALKSEILSPQLAERATTLRRLRNQAAHGRGQISGVDAAAAIDDALLILGDIQRPVVPAADA